MRLISPGSRPGEVEWLFEGWRSNSFAILQNQVLAFRLVAGRVGLHDSRAVGRVLQNIRFAHARSDVGAGAMRHQRRKYDEAARAHRPRERLVAVLFTAHVTEL